MIYLKKFNESNSDIKDDIKYLMGELIHDYEFKNTSYINADDYIIEYSTEHILVNEEFNDMLIALKNKCLKINITFEIFIEYRDNDYPGDGIHSINMRPASIDTYLSMYDSRYKEERMIKNIKYIGLATLLNQPLEIDYEFCLIFKTLK